MVSVLDELDTGFEPTTPGQAPGLMQGYTPMWWIAGGWALDLVAGEQTRHHADLDIGVFRDDVPALFGALDGIELHAAAGGRLKIVATAHDLPPGSNSIWARRAGASKWLFELILNESDGEEWVYRRDPRVRRNRADVVVDVDGLPCLRPELQLLFKAKGLRDRDVADFENHAPRLGSEARSWLIASLALAHPGHPWIARLQALATEEA